MDGWGGGGGGGGGEGGGGGGEGGGGGVMHAWLCHSLFPTNTSLAAAAPESGFRTTHWYTPVSDACTAANVSVVWGPSTLYCTRVVLTTAIPFTSHAHERGEVPAAEQVRLDGREAYCSVRGKDCTMEGGTNWMFGGVRVCVCDGERNNERSRGDQGRGRGEGEWGGGK